MYRCAPPAGEGWMKVGAMEKEHIRLASGARIGLHPFYLTEKALALSPEDLAKRLFDLSPSDIYVRKEKEKWIVRVGNRYLCAHRSFFPKKEYGYFEDELLDSISGALINVPLEERLVGFTSEEALNNYYETKAIQGGADNADKPRT